MLDASSWSLDLESAYVNPEFTVQVQPTTLRVILVTTRQRRGSFSIATVGVHCLHQLEEALQFDECQWLLDGCQKSVIPRRVGGNKDPGRHFCGFRFLCWKKFHSEPGGQARFTASHSGATASQLDLGVYMKMDSQSKGENSFYEVTMFFVCEIA